ncbi:bifunctional hydroxymethylpyrimidine kinase/phosphomethylpyrimidine kinase [bacterium]|nr:bifunctional hydroxymethylpyrimidine kinase/phosphomethylpyrimidine kinase [bacterium]
MADQARLREIIDGFSRVKIGVIGDLVADIFVYGQTRRVSREAPVLILDYVEERLSPGGAANAAGNARALGAQVAVVGAVGDDPPGRELVKSLSDRGIDHAGVITVPDRVTTAKQRIAGASLHTTFQQILRIDRGEREYIGGEPRARLLQSLDDMARRVDALIVSDYGYGMIGENLVHAINEIGKSEIVPVLVDSRYQLALFRDVSVMTPNEPEAEAATGIPMVSVDAVREAGRKLLLGSAARGVLVTRGRQGMMLFEQDGDETPIPIFGSDEIADVTGAGDTVIATYAAALASGASMKEAMVLSNVAGGLVVMKHGTATVSADELREAIERSDPWHGLSH